MPPTPQPRTHYDTLGVSRTASLDEVKKRYRELARKHHPDVNPGDPNAARLFTEITAAYKALSDTASRQTYDAELLLQEKRAANAQARARANDFPGTTTYYPPGGGTASPPPRTAQPRPQNAGAAAANAQNVANEVSRLLQQAQAALVRMRFLEARDLAQQSLRLKRTAEGYEILGDVYRLQNRADDAMNMYTMSLQLDPRNQRVMERFQRIARATSRAAPQPGGGRPSAAGYETVRAPGPGARPGAVPPPGSSAHLRADRRPLAGLLVAFMGYGAVTLLLAYVALFGREAPVTPLTSVALVSQWNGTLLWVLPLIGVLLGLTMAVTGSIRRIDDELVFSLRPGSGRRGAPQVPMGLVLLALSVVSFWAAALLHTIIAALQEGRLDTLLKVFGAVAGVVLFVTAVYDPSRAQVFLFGGNVVFLAFAFGWLLGDIFRPEY